MVRPESPCLDCERRQVGCHAECDDYIGYRERLKVYKDKVLEERKKYKMLRRHTTESERKKWKIPGGGGQW